MSTAGPAWGDTARTQEAPVLLEGAGLANVATADDPKLFTEPASVSLPDVDLNHGAASEGQLVQISDAGGGAGTWSVGVQPQAATGGAGIDVPSQISVAPGGIVSLPVAARVAANADPGEQFGFIVLTRGPDVRRIPYFFLVSRPALEAEQATELQPLQLRVEPPPHLRRIDAGRSDEHDLPSIGFSRDERWFG